jgi:hypothetical protein
MQYTVVHSKDPYLLARLATDLQMEGYIEEEMFDKFAAIHLISVNTGWQFIR